MQPRVTAILVARNGQKHLERTLEALTLQTRQPDAILAVDCGSTDATAELLAVFAPTRIIVADADLSFGVAINAALRATAPPSDTNNVLWLLAQDSAPSPGALAALLQELEIAPSVAVAGPKVMEWVASEYIHDFGESITPYGASVSLVESELDQGQHDDISDVLAVGAGGMLVRQAVWQELGGFDPALPSVDDSLDFCIRVRLAGYRVSVVSAARVATAGDGVAGPNGSSRGKPRRRRMRAERSAQLHRRLVYSPVWALPLHWLSLVPLAFFRSVGQLLRKEPGAILGEFSAAFAAAFRLVRVAHARRSLAKTRTLGWSAIASLRVPTAVVRRRHMLKREASLTHARGERHEFSFFSRGGAWVVLIAACVGLGVLAPLLGAQTLTGGGLLPLSNTVSDLWQSAGYGWRQIGLGFVGAADPFAAVLAVLGTITFWAPSFALVLVYFLAFPLAAFGAWAAASRLTERGGLRAIAALLWVFAPPFLSALAEGRLAAILVHLLLPWLFYAGFAAARSWSASASTALLFAAVVACAPSLAPALLIAWLICVLLSGRRIMRFIGIPLPALALAAPLIWDQALRGGWLALLADPGVPLPSVNASAWQLLLGFPTGDFGGWESLLSGLGLPGVNAQILVPILFAPLVVLALLALFLRGSRGASFALLTAAIGLLTAVGASHLSLATSGDAAVSIWTGSGLSLYWMGLIGASLFALRGLGRFAVAPAVVVSLLVVIVAAPLAAALPLGTSVVAKGIGRTQPAFVAAEADINPQVGTVELSAQASGGIRATIVRGSGATLNDQSTLDSTDTSFDEREVEFANLVGNLASRSGLDSTQGLHDFGIRFVLLRPAELADRPAAESSPLTPEAAEAELRTVTSLDGNAALVPVGLTTFGQLWQSADEADAPGIAALQPHAGGILSRIAFLIAVIVIGATVLLSIPTGAGREAVREAHRDAIRRQAKDEAKQARRQKRELAAQSAKPGEASEAGSTPTDASETSTERGEVSAASVGEPSDHGEFSERVENSDTPAGTSMEVDDAH
jgi:GT2 family glycosyltransferase